MQNKAYKWSTTDYFHAYIKERHYGGYYSTWDDIESVLSDSGLHLVDLKDHTNDYHWSSVADKDHFDHPLSDEQVANSPVHLKYFMLEKGEDSPHFLGSLD